MRDRKRPPRERLMKPGEVAEIFNVEPLTVVEWAQTGKIAAIRTPGGHWRVRQSAVEALLTAPDQPGNESGLARCVTTETSP